MIHPSYQELIATINEGQDLDEAPVVSLETGKLAKQPLLSGTCNKQTCKTDHWRS